MDSIGQTAAIVDSLYSPHRSVTVGTEEGCHGATKDACAGPGGMSTRPVNMTQQQNPMQRLQRLSMMHTAACSCPTVVIACGHSSRSVHKAAVTSQAWECSRLLL
jgi:hypothetical protein